MWLNLRDGSNELRLSRTSTVPEAEASDTDARWAGPVRCRGHSHNTVLAALRAGPGGRAAHELRRRRADECRPSALTRDYRRVEVISPQHCVTFHPGAKQRRNGLSGHRWVKNKCNVIKLIRLIDDHAPAAAGADCLELCGEDVLVPAQRELAAGIELAKALLRKACKIGAQQRGVLAHIMGFGRGHCGLSLPVRSGGECP